MIMLAVIVGILICVFISVLVKLIKKWQKKAKEEDNIYQFYILQSKLLIVALIAFEIALIITILTVKGF